MWISKGILNYFVWTLKILSAPQISRDFEKILSAPLEIQIFRKINETRTPKFGPGGVVKEGSFRVVTLLKIHVWELACRCISIQQSITRSGRMLSDEFLLDLDYAQPVQRGIRLDFPVVASCLRPVSTPVSATMISMTCYKLQNEHPGSPKFFLTFFSESTWIFSFKNEVLAL